MTASACISTLFVLESGSFYAPAAVRRTHYPPRAVQGFYKKPMVNVTHEERGPWAAIWDNG